MLKQKPGPIFSELAYAYHCSLGKGQIRTRINDFRVEEQLGFDLTGAGEHVFLRIEKRHESTDDVSKRLAGYAKVRRQDIGYAGLKDKNAIAIQWFSVHLPGRETPDWSEFETDSIRVVGCRRHHRKLRKGALKTNRFEILIRNLVNTDQQRIEDCLSEISQGGVPNYFGPQRFGYQEQNIRKVAELFEGSANVSDRYRRGIYLSAARAYVFNQVLSTRVASNNWNRAIPGDAFMLEGSRAFFKPEIFDQEIHRRIQIMDIHPTGVLWGKGDQIVTDEALIIEQNIADGNTAFSRGLEEFGLEMSRRSLRLKVSQLQWGFQDKTSLRLLFILPAGGYATSMLRELVDC